MKKRTLRVVRNELVNAVRGIKKLKQILLDDVQNIVEAEIEIQALLGEERAMIALADQKELDAAPR